MKLPASLPVIARVLLNTDYGRVIEPLVVCCKTRHSYAEHDTPCCPECETLTRTAVKMRSQELLFEGKVWYVNVYMCAGCDKIYYAPIQIREPRPSDNYRTVEHENVI